MASDLPKVSVVFVTYNRMVTLRPTLESFLRLTDYPRDRLELIVTDDGSPQSVQSEIRGMPFDVFCLSDRRSGLGANTNRGLAAATGDFVLQLQDDWSCEGPADYLVKAVGILSARPDIGLLILNTHIQALASGGRFEHEGWDVRMFAPGPQVSADGVERFAYSDWPHLKRQDFIRHVGPYLEGRPMWETEIDFGRRVARQNRYGIADFAALSVFRHIGEAHSYNWPWKKRVESWITRLPGGEMAMRLYRRYKRGGARRVSEG